MDHSKLQEEKSRILFLIMCTACTVSKTSAIGCSLLPAAEASRDQSKGSGRTKLKSVFDHEWEKNDVESRVEGLAEEGEGFAEEEVLVVQAGGGKQSWKAGCMVWPKRGRVWLKWQRVC
jgi:hypothetical protein